MNFPSLRAIAIFVLVAIAAVALGLYLRAWYAPEWMALDSTQKPPAMRSFAVEADCYSQLARVQRILNGQGLLQNHFEVENWPEGLTPSTTAPFDYAILLLYFPLWLFTSHPLDWAGALVSPALWLALVGFWMLIRSRQFTLMGRALLIAGTAVLPSLIWGTAFGRPRHQSLILALMAVGLTAEYERWQLELNHKRTWNIFAGAIWGLACWTSLFEPVVVAGSVIVFNLIARRRENPAFLAAFGTVLLAMSLLEGGHIFGNLRQVYELSSSPYAINWLQGIGEVAPVDFVGMNTRLTFLYLITPILAWCLWPRRGGNKTDALLILLTLLLTIFTWNQRRWSYYASLAELFLVVRFCQAARSTEGPSLNVAGVAGRLVLLALTVPFFYWCLQLGTSPSGTDLLLILLTIVLIGFALLPNEWAGILSFGNPLNCEGLGQVTPNFWIRGAVLAVLLISVVQVDSLQLENDAKSPPLQPSLQLLRISHVIDEPGGIMAPWWLSPGLLYFSGHPIVSGSSHAGMSGIVASAKFFTATSWSAAEQILDQRQVRWVMVWDDPARMDPVLDTSQQILGLPQVTEDEPGNSEQTVAQLLIEDRLVPTAFHLRAVVDQCKLYEYTRGD